MLELLRPDSPLMWDAARRLVEAYAASLNVDPRNTSDAMVRMSGEVTLHGVTRPVRFDVTRMECGADTVLGHDGCGASVTGRISRSAFGMSFAVPLVGDEVALDFAIKAIRVPDEGATQPP